MCRLLAYMGTPIVIDKLLYQPKNSLVNQSICARELEEPLNGDGFGIGWYTPDVSDEPINLVAVGPAWSNRNLRNLAPKVKTGCFVAHVRAATVGEVSESNCHPFQYKSMLMMHNGGVEDFARIKRKLREPLTDSLYNWIKGQTDSEHLFAYIVSYLQNNNDAITPETLMKAFENLFSTLKLLMKENGIREPAYLNMVITDGKFIVGTRYVTDPNEEPLTMYHSEGSRYVIQNGVTQLVAKEDDDQAVLIVSEKLTDDKYWTPIPKNHFVVVDESLQVSVRPIQD
jgi:ergothioneine biosynthesis protein EgtC